MWAAAERMWAHCRRESCEFQLRPFSLLTVTTCAENTANEASNAAGFVPMRTLLSPGAAGGTMAHAVALGAARAMLLPCDTFSYRCLPSCLTI